MKVSEVLQLLQDDGWYLVAMRGCHQQYKHPSKLAEPSVPSPARTSGSSTICSFAPRPTHASSSAFRPIDLGSGLALTSSSTSSRSRLSSSPGIGIGGEIGQTFRAARSEHAAGGYSPFNSPQERVRVFLEPYLTPKGQRWAEPLSSLDLPDDDAQGRAEAPAWSKFWKR